MSYEWIRRRKRYLSFWYIFPEVVAPWIQFKRCLLRVLWFFTHPVDEFVDDLGELIAWPFVTMAMFFAWVLQGVRDFFKDLFAGIEACFQYLGRLPVWTGAAIAGTLGIIMTVLLFLLQVSTFEPVPLSTAAAMEEQHAPEPVATPQPIISPPPIAEPKFDPFAGQPAPQPTVWTPTPLPAQPESGLMIDIDRLDLPFGWDSRRRIRVVSNAASTRPRGTWSQFERMTAMNGWSITGLERARQAVNFTPYIARQGVRNSQPAPSWVTTAASISPYMQVENRREPAVSITRTAPRTAGLGESLRYELVVSNQGAEPLDSVTVRESVSAIDRVMDVDPPANVIDQKLVWNVTNLQPREQRRIMIELRPDQLMPISGGSTVQVKTSVAAVCRVTEPMEQAPPITPEPREDLNAFIPEPEPQRKPAARPAPSANFGMILPVFDEEPAPEPEPPPQQPEPPPQEPEPSFVFEPAPMKPAKPAPAIMPFIPEEPQQPTTREKPLQKTKSTAGKGGVPIFFEMGTPTMTAIDKPVKTTFEIRNPGQAELTDLVILVEVTGELDHERGRILEHRVGRLAPGAVYRTRLTTTAIRDGRARVKSTLTSAEDLESILEAEIEVTPPRKETTQLSAAEFPPQGRPTSMQ